MRLFVIAVNIVFIVINFLPLDDGALHNGVVQSLNTIAAQVLDTLTPAASYDFLINTLHMNLEPADKDYAPLAAGQLSIGTTVREMASAYTIFPCGGTYRQGRTFSHIYSHNGSLICENKPIREATITPKTAYWMTDILQDAVSRGTGTRAKLTNMPCAGKTGTTTDSKDFWFVGYTPYYVGAVWTGYVKPAKISIQGNPSAMIWNEIMTAIHEDLPYKDFPVPNDIELPKDIGHKPDGEWHVDNYGNKPVLPEEDLNYSEYGTQWNDFYAPGQEETQWSWSALPWVDTELESSWTTPQNPILEILEPDIPSISPESGTMTDEFMESDESEEYLYEIPENLDDGWSAVPEWNAWGEESAKKGPDAILEIRLHPVFLLLPSGEFCACSGRNQNDKSSSLSPLGMPTAL